MVVFISAYGLTYFGGIPVRTPPPRMQPWYVAHGGGLDKPVIPGQHCVQLVSPPKQEIRQNLFGIPAWVYIHVRKVNRNGCGFT